MPQTQPTPALLALAEDAANLIAAGQKAAVTLFEAEVKAIGALLGALPDEDAAAAAARHRAEEAAVEEGFDNMPV